MKSKYFIIIIAMFILNGCATVAVPVQIQHQAEIEIGKKSVMILPIDGDLGQSFEENLKARLVSEGYVGVVDRTRMYEVMRGQCYAETIMVLDDMVKLGKLMNASVIVAGRYDGRYTEETEFDCDGRDVNYTVTGTLKTRGHIDIIDVATSKIIASKKIENEDSDSESGDDDDPADEIDTDKLVDDMAAKDVMVVVKTISPWVENSHLSFKKDKSLPELEKAINLVKVGRYDQARMALVDLSKRTMNDKSKSTVLWNLGLVYELQGDYPSAIKVFEDGFVLSSDGKFTSEIKKIKKGRNLLR